MTDRVLTEERLVLLDGHVERPHPGTYWWCATVKELVASHRLQAARIQELEKITEMQHRNLKWFDDQLRLQELDTKEPK